MAVNPEFVDKVAQEIVTGYKTHNPKLVDEAMNQLLELKRQQQLNPSYVDLTYHPTLAKLSQNPQIKEMLGEVSIIDVDAQRHSFLALDKYGNPKAIGDNSPNPIQLGSQRQLTPTEQAHREREQEERARQHEERTLRQQEEAFQRHKEELERQQQEMRRQQEELARRREQLERQERERMQREHPRI